MITEQTKIKPLKAKAAPIMTALYCYRKWKRSWLRGTIWFIADVIDYLLRGVVISRPDCFGMAKVIDISDGNAKGIHPAWFVRIAAGDLKVLLDALPMYLPQIAFCRRNDGRVRVYSLMRLTRLSLRNQRSEIRGQRSEVRG